MLTGAADHIQAEEPSHERDAWVPIVFRPARRAPWTAVDFDERFLAHVSPGLELGRSFVADERQREFLPLSMLWRGIVDPTFGNSITALVVVDLRRTDPRLVGRYMRRPEAAAFLDWHAAREREGMLDSA